jgi:carbamate kinase
VRDGTFAGGSMGPKVVAASDFVRRTGRLAAIGALEDAVAVLTGQAGTLIEADLAAVAGTTAGRR